MLKPEKHTETYNTSFAHRATSWTGCLYDLGPALVTPSQGRMLRTSFLWTNTVEGCTSTPPTSRTSRGHARQHSLQPAPRKMIVSRPSEMSLGACLARLAGLGMLVMNHAASPGRYRRSEGYMKERTARIFLITIIISLGFDVPPWRSILLS